MAEVATALYDETINEFNPMAFAANQQQNKTYTFKDMLKQDGVKNFVMAMLHEIQVHEDQGHWTLMKRGDVPMDKQANGKVKTIMSIWSFKRKRYASGLLLKHEARLCAHGGMCKYRVRCLGTRLGKQSVRDK
eukprot:15271358-Ditylum_brightwellii.AAC.1